METDVEDLVGKYIVRGWQIQGPRPYMEDVMLIDHTLDKNTGDLIVGLFDGHGGRNCAEWLGKNMKDIIDKQYNSKESNGDMKECLIQSFTKANKKLLSDKSIGNSGSTGLVIFYYFFFFFTIFFLSNKLNNRLLSLKMVECMLQVQVIVGQWFVESIAKNV